MLYSKFLFHLNLKRSLQCIQVILDADLPLYHTVLLLKLLKAFTPL